MSDFTEDGLIEAMRTILGGEMPGVRVGPGDDAAVVDLDSPAAILTTDLLIEGVHFERDTLSPRDLGYKSIAVNVSDVAAMGGAPRYALVALAVPADIEMAWIVELFGGLRDGAAEYEASVVGGDTSRGDRIVVSVAVAGVASKRGVVTRDGARPGDRIVVTGWLGAAAGGLRLANAAPAEVSDVLGSDWARGLLEAQARPRARVREGQALADAGATAMIDVSDGLAKDLGRLCGESRVRAAVFEPQIPIATDLMELHARLDAEPIQLALTGGEDYELVATIAPEAVGRVKTRLDEEFGTPLTEIGEIREGHDLVIVKADGREEPLEPEGWDHFAG